MNEITAAIIGAIASAFLMALANISNRRERDIRELFHRINSLEKEVAKQQNPRRLRGLWSALDKTAHQSTKQKDFEAFCWQSDSLMGGWFSRTNLGTQLG